MIEQEIEDLKWSCIVQAQNWNNPEQSDGYTEHEVLQAVSKMYEKCKEMWEKDAEKWKELMKAVESENEGYSKENIEEGVTTESIGWHVMNIMKQ